MQPQLLLLFVLIVFSTIHQGFTQPVARSKCTSTQESKSALQKRGTCFSSNSKDSEWLSPCQSFPRRSLGFTDARTSL
ncbi:hypothetical protein FA10DRAFT_265631 [Acaromyces ingoldii]|uniref:Uncharacterized protein n=1 Tax=Acaromyces ingoldii TaxID=215250 RepID=A0A316YRZ7_9BASI|nr:hypothetical protein FA10DRAFT_265631 [Acaromyces ingoldii]PWN91786.1 hypothetical protein FA10DRAFT_265631 [Acaromyces ingoldii]